jgi:hypothetical protein
MNRLGYITDRDDVYCAVRTGYLNEISRFTLKESSAMGQAVNGPHVTSETRVIPCPFRYLQSGTVARYTNVISPMFHINLCLYVDLTRRSKSKPGNIANSNALSAIRELSLEVRFMQC